MASMKRIPTPLPQHLHRFRLQALPVLIFLGLLMLVATLWDQGKMSSGGAWITGEVNAASVNIYSSYDGILMPVTLSRSDSADLLAQVDKGDVLARIDPRIFDKELASLRAELEALKADLNATEMDLALDNAERKDDRLNMIRRLSLDAERMELEVLDRKTQLSSDKIEAMRAEGEYRRAEAAGRNGMENDYLLESRKHMRDYFNQQVEGQSIALAKAEDQLEKVRARLGQLLAIQPLDARTETALAPIRHSIAAQEALVRSVEIKREMLEVQSPITGKITAVYCQAGQAVRTGDLLMTVTAEYSNEVIAYIRETQSLKLGRGQKVILRPRFSRGDPITGEVSRVGRMVTEIPSRQLRNPDQPEWGLPICITIDPASGLQPGQLLDIAPSLGRN